MTNEEAMKIGEWFLYKQCDLYRTIRATEYTDNDIWNATNIAFKSLENANKYRWHDLRKDPFDLPPKDGKLSEIVDVCFGEEPGHSIIFYGVYCYESIPAEWYTRKTDGKKICKYKGCKSDTWYVGGSERHDVIAWREIERFEENK